MKIQYSISKNLISPKGKHNIAQGNALGIDVNQRMEALKGRNKFRRWMNKP
jgi:hypothetical protein